MLFDPNLVDQEEAGKFITDVPVLSVSAAFVPSPQIPPSSTKAPGTDANGQELLKGDTVVYKCAQDTYSWHTVLYIDRDGHAFFDTPRPTGHDADGYLIDRQRPALELARARNIDWCNVKGAVYGVLTEGKPLERDCNGLIRVANYSAVFEPTPQNIDDLNSKLIRFFPLFPADIKKSFLYIYGKNFPDRGVTNTHGRAGGWSHSRHANRIGKGLPGLMIDFEAAARRRDQGGCRIWQTTREGTALAGASRQARLANEAYRHMKSCYRLTGTVRTDAEFEAQQILFDNACSEGEESARQQDTPDRDFISIKKKYEKIENLLCPTTGVLHDMPGARFALEGALRVCLLMEDVPQGDVHVTIDTEPSSKEQPNHAREMAAAQRGKPPNEAANEAEPKGSGRGCNRAKFASDFKAKISEPLGDGMTYLHHYAGPDKQIFECLWKLYPEATPKNLVYVNLFTAYQRFLVTTTRVHGKLTQYVLTRLCGLGIQIHTAKQDSLDMWAIIAKVAELIVVTYGEKAVREFLSREC